MFNHILRNHMLHIILWKVVNTLLTQEGITWKGMNLMPKGPQGQKRPADAIGCAVMVAQIATGEIQDKKSAPKGVAGGKARSEKLSSQKRAEIAKTAAAARWV